MIHLTINDKIIEAEQGITILQAAEKNGIKIPTLCFHKMLSPYGACRICLVEIIQGERHSIQTSCTFPATEGLIVKTNTERILKTRKIVLELLLAQCPDSEIIKTMAQEYGVTQTRFKLESTADCISCGLCVRVCSEITGMNAISFTSRGPKRKVQTPFNKISDTCIGCGACAYICPTKAIKIEEAD